MEEKVFEMEYIINGEKYLITATKVANGAKEGIENPSDFKEPIEIGKEFMNIQEEVVVPNEDGTIISIVDIPDYIDLPTWLSIIKDYNIVLTK